MPPGNKKGKGKKGGNAVKTRRLEDIAKDYDPKTFEVYGQVDKVLGNRRFEVKVQRLTAPSEIAGTITCSIKGSFRQRICRDMAVLVKLYDFNTMQGQIIDGYSTDELGALKAAGMWDYPLNTQSVQDKPLSDSDSDSESESEIEDAAPSEQRSAAIATDDIDIDAI